VPFFCSIVLFCLLAFCSFVMAHFSIFSSFWRLFFVMIETKTSFDGSGSYRIGRVY
jgi:hypothetical protein